MLSMNRKGAQLQLFPIDQFGQAGHDVIWQYTDALIALPLVKALCIEVEVGAQETSSFSHEAGLSNCGR